MGEDRPVEWFSPVTAPLLTCPIGQANGIFRIGHGFAVVVDPAQGCIVVLEIDQALCEIRGGNRKKEEREECEPFDFAWSCHGLGIGGGEGEKGWGRPAQSTSYIGGGALDDRTDSMPSTLMPFVVEGG